MPFHPTVAELDAWLAAPDEPEPVVVETSGSTGHPKRVVLSRRAYLEETQKETRDSFLTNLKIGEVREGTVSSVVSFGAFVDLGGMDGLIHVSELSWKHVDHPGSVVAVGDHVKVQVLDVDMSRERISLSLKATQADPWQEFAESHEVGEMLSAELFDKRAVGVAVGEALGRFLEPDPARRRVVASFARGRVARAVDRDHAREEVGVRRASG